MMSSNVPFVRDSTYLTRVVHLFILNVYSLELTEEKRRICLLFINHIFITSGEMIIGYFHVKLVNLLVFSQISKPNIILFWSMSYIFLCNISCMKLLREYKKSF